MSVPPALRALPYDIQMSMRSIQNADATTLADLRVLLGYNATETPQFPVKPLPSTKKSMSKVSSSKSITRPTTNTVKVHASSGHKVRPLGIAGRKKLATEIFNTSLKSLAEVSKIKYNQNTLTGNINSDKGIQPRTQNPLQPCSPNKQRKATSIKPVPKSTSGDVSATAECAVLALDCLRCLDLSEAKCKAEQHQQRERGALILIEKLISAGQLDKAAGEATKFHRQHWGAEDKHKLQLSFIGDPSVNSSSTTLRVSYDPASFSQSEFHILSSYQSQLLRLAIAQNSQCITIQFVEEASLTTNGSPANVVLCGYKAGHLNAEAAGEKIRIIGQALLKLYSQSVAEDLSSKPEPQACFKLLIEALVIKLESLKMLGHKADLEKEFWGHIAKGLKSLDGGGDALTHGTFIHATAVIHSAKTALGKHGYEAQVPFTLVNAIFDLAEKTSDYRSALDFLKDYSQTAHSLIPEFQTIISWRTITMQCKMYLDHPTKLVPILQSLAESFGAVRKTKIEHFEDVLLHGARVRKSMVSLHQSIIKAGSEHSISSEDKAISECCYAVLQNLAHLLTEVLTAKKVINQPGRFNTAASTFARTFNAALEIIRASGVPTAMNAFEGLAKLLHATKELLKKKSTHSLNADTVAYLESLLLETSNVYWMYYLEQHPECPIETCLYLSCSAVEHVSLIVQKGASFGMKLEKMALLKLKAKDVSSACRSFAEAVSYYVRQGALEDAVTAAISGSASSVWSRRGTDSYSLGKTLSSLAKLRLTYGTKSDLEGQWMYLDEDLPVFHQALLLEAHLPALDDAVLTAEQSRNLENNTRKVLDRIEDTTHSTYKLRLISMMLQKTLKNSSIPKTLLAVLTSHNGRLHLPLSASQDTIQSAKSQYLYNLVNLQVSTASGLAESEALQEHMSRLSAIILEFKDQVAVDVVVNDFNLLVGQLQVVSVVCHVLDCLDVMTSSLTCIDHLIKLVVPGNSSQRIDILTRLGLAHHRLRNSIQSRKAFAQAESLSPSSSDDLFRWAASFVQSANCLTDSANYSDAVNKLTKAAAFYGQATRVEKLPGHSRFRQELVLCKAAEVASRVAFQGGDLDTAMQLARQFVKIGSQIWQVLARPQVPDKDDSTIGDDSTLQNLTDEMANLKIPPNSNTQNQSLKSSSYWDQINMLCSGLDHMIRLSIHVGLYQDGLYYAEFLRTIAEASTSKVRAYRALMIQSLVQARAGHVVEARRMLETCGNRPRQASCFEDYQSTLDHAEALLDIGDHRQAKTLLENFDPPKSVKPVAVEMPLKEGIKRAPVRGKPKSNHSIKVPPKRAAPKILAVIVENETSQHETHPPNLWEVLQSRAQCLKDKVSLLQDQYLTQDSRIRNIDDPNEAIMAATILYRQAMAELSSDAVKCVLAETAVALPVRYKSSRKSGRVSFTNGISTSKPLAKNNGKGKFHMRATGVEQRPAPGEQLVLDAKELLHRADYSIGLAATPDMLHIAHKLQSKLALLSSAMDIPSLISSSELAVQCLEPKDIIQQREHSIIRAERLTKDKSQLQTWPVLSQQHEQASSGGLHEVSIDDLNDIPKTWSIISLSLSSDQTELLVSKITSGRSPFLVRIPLSRSEMDLDEEAEFSFVDARVELADIIAAANESTHDKRGQGDRETRKAWYAEREELDARLENWLINVENVWLGGFRGLFASTVFDDDVLAKFGYKLNRILDKHLPSRQKSAPQSGNEVALHAHVHELFLGLGCPDEIELDDATTDLLYFVVDILQFSGERNAYDEIDFDAMLVDTFDIMREFHQSNSQNPAEIWHTILVIDKEMAMFPWESLPCLQLQSVSRMPSLSSIIQRIKVIRDGGNGSATAHVISLTQGAYILNPSSDLVSTQQTFQPVFLTHLPTFTSHINTTPTESEFTTYLTNHSLLLYFGHGSGAQYIRGRTVRNLLAPCAVTFLMGCSSAKMTEVGKFESYGMPGYYIGAGDGGCMGLVGTLWDVTDRDIDRFAMKCLAEWGLVPEDDELVEKALEKTKSKCKSKGNRGIGDVCGSKNKSRTGIQKTPALSKDGEVKKGRVTLDEAVCKGRDACLLRYLNGAAVVMYGVPVLLS